MTQRSEDDIQAINHAIKGLMFVLFDLQSLLFVFV